MSERLPSSDRQEGVGGYEQYLANKFRNMDVPLKIRKIELLKEVGLPIPDTDVFTSKEIDRLKESVLNRRTDNKSSLIVRFACMPDKFSMPSVAIEFGSDVSKAINEIQQFTNTRDDIKNLILQELTPKNQAKYKISGRYLLESSRLFPLEEVLELYKGARNTNVLNNPSVEDPNFLHLEKRSGQFLKPTKAIDEENSLYKRDELKDIYLILQGLKERIALVKEVIAKSQRKKSDDVLISLEFSYLNGRLVFSDID